MSKECCGPDEPVLADDCCGAGGAGHDQHDEHDDSGGSGRLRSWWQDRDVLVPLGAGLLLGAGYLLEWSGEGVAATVALAASLALGASTFAPGAVRRLGAGRVGVGLLMTIAAAGAVVLGHVGEAAALAFLFSIAEALEDRAMAKARGGLRALLSLVPQTATVSRGLLDTEVLVADLVVGDVLLVRAGDRVATDGVVATGRSSIDASAITGESIPVEVGPGSEVSAGSVNGSGTLRIEATAGGHDNSLTTIVRLVEQAQARKGARARLADRIARPLVPIVLIAAALIALYGVVLGDPATWTERALVVLVAVSPCALAIAVPVTVISAIGAASRFGVVIKSGEAFETLGAVQVVAFDKTGTLTRNEPRLVAVAVADGYDRDQVVLAAAALEASSTHPLAAAVLADSPAPPAAVQVREYPGQGLTGTVDGRRVRVGSTRWIDTDVLGDERDRLEGEGMTVVAVCVDDRLAGVIGIRDELRPEAAEAVAELHRRGIETLMLTGDNERTARALAAQVGIDDVRAELTPAEKAAAIDELRTGARTGAGTGAGRRVAMVGDGINDTPALATADVGIAMGVSGSAAAVESADVAFTGHDLRLLAQALGHAGRGRLIMTTNIVLALAIVVVLFPLALLGVVGLAGVVLVHESAEVVVIANGLRAARGRPALPPLTTAAPHHRAASDRRLASSGGAG